MKLSSVGIAGTDGKQCSTGSVSDLSLGQRVLHRSAGRSRSPYCIARFYHFMPGVLSEGRRLLARAVPRPLAQRLQSAAEFMLPTFNSTGTAPGSRCCLRSLK
jgi:hypothetical protein